MPDTPLILHHYDFSNYAEKARLASGYKGLDWRACTIPPVAPKPDLTPLTGGYRRTPVLQIGADIFCDTHLILRELERRQPEPTLFPVGYRGDRRHDRLLGRASAVPADIALRVRHQPRPATAGLQADRSRDARPALPDEATVKRAAKRNAPNVRAQIAEVEDVAVATAANGSPARR